MDKGKTGTQPTTRFNLDLVEPTDDQYNEFSYAKLVNEAVRKKDGRLLNDEASSDQKLVVLAKKFEEKYGPKSKRIIHDKDYMDIGFGYDSDDSFVDDTEAYDEFVPHSLDTKLGGFYINSGDLEFKDSEVADPDENDFKPKKAPIKKQLSATPQTIIASKKVKLAKQRKALQGAQKPALKAKLVQKSLQSKSSKGADEVVPVIRIGDNLSNSSQMLSTLLQSGGLSSTQHTSATSLLVPMQTSGASGSSMTHSDLTAAVTPSDTLLKHILTGSLSAKTEKMDTSSNGPVKAAEPVVVPKVKPVLPDGLPEALVSKITLLELSIVKNNEESKSSIKARTPMYDGQLIEIDQLAKQLSMKIRATVFEYVAYLLKISKQTLTGKIKKAIRRKEDVKIKLAIDALQKAIDARMPALLSKYEENVKALGLSTSTPQDSSLKIAEDDATSDSIADLAQETSPTSEAHDSKPRRIRKTFHWDEEMRTLLHDVVQKKINAELLIQKKVTNWEEIITEFINNDIRLLWPKGWMPKSVLLKVSEPVYKPYVSQQQDGKSAAGAAATAAPKKVVKMQKDNTSNTKKETAAPKMTKESKPVVAVTSNISRPASIVMSAPNVPLVKPLVPPPPVSTKFPLVKPPTAQQIKPMPSVASLPESANKLMNHPAILLNISQLGKSSMLGIQPNPIIHLSSGEGPKAHSSTVTMSLSPQSIQTVLPTSAAHLKQQHTVTPSQWSQILNASKQLLVNSNSATTTSLTPSGVQKPLPLVPNISNLTGPSSNSQVLQEHSYQKAISTALAASNPSATQSTTTMFPKVVINPLNLQYK